MAAEQRPRRALLLPGSLGMGHGATARAMAASLTARGWTTSIGDVMAMLGGPGQAVGERVFRSLLALPGAYDALHFGALRTGGRGAGWIDDRATARIVPRLRDVLARTEPDLVISVFATAASAVSRLKPEFPTMRTVTFSSDLNPHRLWVHPGTDCYLVKSTVSEAFIRRFDPDARVVVAPAPVRPEFYDAPPRATARQSLGVPDGARCVLVMAGGWGLAPVAEVAIALAESDVHTLAVAGRNRSLATRLDVAAATDGRVHAFGLTDRIPELMAAADLVVTTPGDTCSEARVVGRRLVLLDVVAGHGRENLQHELELGDAVVASTIPNLLVRRVLRALGEDGDPPADTARRGRWEAGLDAVLATIRLADAAP